MFRPLRSVLYVPAINERAIAKAATLACDAVILDLEDAVAPESKSEARAMAKAALETRLFEGKQVIIRVNGFEAEADRMADDLAELLPFGPDAILFPKISSADEAARAESAMDHHFAPDTVALWLMIETPRAILNLHAIAAEAEKPGSRLSTFVIGTNDLSKDMRIPPTPSRLALLHALSSAVLAARGYQLRVLDGVYGALHDAAGFEAECRQGHGLGFDGKTLIHPNQIGAANAIFSPSAYEIADAQRIVSAFEAPENAGKGVIVVDGRMSERLHYEAALRILASRPA